MPFINISYFVISFCMCPQNCFTGAISSNCASNILLKSTSFFERARTSSIRIPVNNCNLAIFLYLCFLSSLFNILFSFSYSSSTVKASITFISFLEIGFKSVSLSIINPLDTASLKVFFMNVHALSMLVYE